MADENQNEQAAEQPVRDSGPVEGVSGEPGGSPGEAMSADASEQVEKTAEETVSAPEGPVAPAAETEQPAAEEPAAEEPTAEEPASDEPAAEEPAAQEPAAEEPAAEEPTAEEPTAEEPAEGAPVADAEPAADVEAEAAAAEAPDAETAVEEPEAPAAEPLAPKKKRKRLPRSLRHRHSKPKRERPAERKAITRLPNPEHPRGRRQERRGVVVSSGMDKTIVVRVDAVKAHPKYKKVVRRSSKFHAHDEQNQAKVGDVVRIVETRPLSKTKNWRLAEIVEVAQ